MNELTSLVKLNALKHHYSYLQRRLDEWTGIQWDKVREELQELGTNQFDVYTGHLTPKEICDEIDHYLSVYQICSRSDIRRWLGKQGYKTLTISDNSRWVIRESKSGDAHAHIHPARFQAEVKRIKANHLKTAVALMFENTGTNSPISLITTQKINDIRINKLGLSPVKSLSESRKISETVRFILYLTELPVL